MVSILREKSLSLFFWLDWKRKMNTDDIMNIAVFGLAVGVAAHTLNLLGKPIKKGKGFSWW